MGLIIRIISHPEGESIQQWQYNLPDEGGIIGRSIGVNLQLNDSHRTISGIHATIKRMIEVINLQIIVLMEPLLIMMRYL